MIYRITKPKTFKIAGIPISVDKEITFTSEVDLLYTLSLSDLDGIEELIDCEWISLKELAIRYNIKEYSEDPVHNGLEYPLAFVKWYSGMETEKIAKAYRRWLKEK